MLGLDELQSLCRSPWGLERYSPLGDCPLLVVDTHGAASAAELDALAARLRLLPCPVIAVGPVPAPLARGVDVMLAEASGVAALARNIEAFPRAAMTLVQLLRHNEDVAPAEGLFAESLAYATLQGGPEFAAVHANGLTGECVGDSAGDSDEPPLLMARDGGTLHLRFNRPHVRNAYNSALRDAFYEALNLLRMDDALERAVVSGAGGCFSVGGDLAEFGQVPDPSTAHAIRASRSVAHALLELAPRLEFRLHRACVGSGIELPAFAGRVVATGDAFVQLPEIRLGLLPGAGGTVSIPRRIGRHNTAWLALSGRRVRAATALQWGLFDELVD